MKRTTVNLPDDLKAALERAAAARGVTQAELIRGALADATAEHDKRPRLPLFDSARGMLADHVDSALAAGFGLERV